MTSSNYSPQDKANDRLKYFIDGLSNINSYTDKDKQALAYQQASNNNYNLIDPEVIAKVKSGYNSEDSSLLDVIGLGKASAYQSALNDANLNLKTKIEADKYGGIDKLAEHNKQEIEDKINNLPWTKYIPFSNASRETTDLRRTEDEISENNPYGKGSASNALSNSFVQTFKDIANLVPAGVNMATNTVGLGTPIPAIEKTEREKELEQDHPYASSAGSLAGTAVQLVIPGLDIAKGAVSTAKGIKAAEGIKAVAPILKEAGKKALAGAASGVMLTPVINEANKESEGDYSNATLNPTDTDWSGSVMNAGIGAGLGLGHKTTPPLEKQQVRNTYKFPELNSGNAKKIKIDPPSDNILIDDTDRVLDTRTYNPIYDKEGRPVYGNIKTGEIYVLDYDPKAENYGKQLSFQHYLEPKELQELKNRHIQSYRDRVMAQIHDDAEKGSNFAGDLLYRKDSYIGDNELFNYDYLRNYASKKDSPFNVESKYAKPGDRKIYSQAEYDNLTPKERVDLEEIKNITDNPEAKETFEAKLGDKNNIEFIKGYSPEFRRINNLELQNKIASDITKRSKLLGDTNKQSTWDRAYQDYVNDEINKVFHNDRLSKKSKEKYIIEIASKYPNIEKVPGEYSVRLKHTIPEDINRDDVTSWFSGDTVTSYSSANNKSTVISRFTPFIHKDDYLAHFLLDKQLKENPLWKNINLEGKTREEILDTIKSFPKKLKSKIYKATGDPILDQTITNGDIDAFNSRIDNIKSGKVKSKITASDAETIRKNYTESLEKYRGSDWKSEILPAVAGGVIGSLVSPGYGTVGGAIAAPLLKGGIKLGFNKFILPGLRLTPSEYLKQNREYLINTSSSEPLKDKLIRKTKNQVMILPGLNVNNIPVPTAKPEQTKPNLNIQEPNKEEEVKEVKESNTVNPSDSNQANNNPINLPGSNQEERNIYGFYGDNKLANVIGSILAGFTPGALSNILKSDTAIRQAQMINLGTGDNPNYMSREQALGLSMDQIKDLLSNRYKREELDLTRANQRNIMDRFAKTSEQADRRMDIAQQIATQRGQKIQGEYAKLSGKVIEDLANLQKAEHALDLVDKVVEEYEHKHGGDMSKFDAWLAKKKAYLSPETNNAFQILYDIAPQIAPVLGNKGRTNEERNQMLNAIPQIDKSESINAAHRHLLHQAITTSKQALRDRQKELDMAFGHINDDVDIPSLNELRQNNG